MISYYGDDAIAIIMSKPRPAIVTISVKDVDETQPHLLAYHWVVVEFNDEQIVLTESLDSDHVIVLPSLCVASVTYCD